MNTNVKRFTISVTPGMENVLEAVKKEHYPEATQSDMLKDLITRGLDLMHTGNSQMRKSTEQTI